MPVCYGFARWSYGGDTVHAGRATVMPRNKTVLFRSPVRPGKSWFKKMKPPGPHPVKAGSTRCIMIQYGVCRRRYGVDPVGPDVHTVATPGLKSGTG